MGAEPLRKYVNFEVDPASLTDLPPLTVHGAAEFLDREPAETRWIIPGVLPAGVPAILASQGGLGKSFLALQLVVALAAGKAWLGHPAQAPQPAYYLSVEDGAGVVHRRFHAIIAGYRRRGDWTPEDEANLLRNFCLITPNWESRDATSYLPEMLPCLDNILTYAESRGLEPGLVIIDTLARVSQGDENTVQALRPVLQVCSQLAARGYTPWMLHHTGKGQDGARRSPKERPSLGDRLATEWVRGSSAIVDNFRCVVQLAAVREDEAERAGLDPEKARDRGYLVMGVTKLNGGSRAPWTFLEQEESGTWAAPADGPDTLAAIRGAKAQASLSKQQALLVDLFHATRHGGTPDKTMLAERHCGDAKSPAAALRLLVMKLRNAGFVQKASLDLTAAGLNRVMETGMETPRHTDEV